MNPRTYRIAALDPALTLLPPHMRSDEARVMLIAIALQESGLRHRRQISGPAVGFSQFELIGCRGVLEHPATRVQAETLCRTLLIEPDALAVYSALEFADVLAAGFARLYLWQYPGALPSVDADPEEGWSQYVVIWRPGKPHRERWDENWHKARGAVVASSIRRLN